MCSLFCGTRVTQVPLKYISSITCMSGTNCRYIYMRIISKCWVASIFQQLERATEIVACSRISVGWGVSEGKHDFRLTRLRFLLRWPPPNPTNRALGRKPREPSTFSQKLRWEIFLRRLCSACANRRFFFPLYPTREPLQELVITCPE